MAVKKVIRETYRDLVSQYEKLNSHYYDHDSPLVDDASYDSLVREIRQLEETYPELAKNGSSLEKVGGSVSQKFSQVAHNPPMLSLGNIFSEDELNDFADKCVKNSESLFVEFSAELKFDGLAIEIEYKEGNLIRASTRGDGETGEDVTENIKTIKSLPHMLAGNFPSYVSVRGEVYLTHEEFERINSERAKDGEMIFANPRNAAAGSLRQLDSSVVARRNLSVVIYGIGSIAGKTIADHRALYIELKKMGLPVSDTVCFGGTTDVLEFYRTWRDNRYLLPHDIDGVVVKLTDYSLREKLGSTSKAPRWAVAWKFPSEEAVTRLLSVEHSLGRTGVVTPVANLVPINIGGVLVKRATLHNYREIERLGVMIGDHVSIIRAGDVIPKILSAVTERRTGGEVPIEEPKNCPSCGALLTREDIFYRCENPKCSGKLLESLLYFVSKDGMDIEFFGPELVRRAYDAGMLKDPSDIYLLNKESLLALDRMGDILAEKILLSIDNRRNVSLPLFLRSLGIRNVGDHVAKVLAKGAGSLEKLYTMARDELCSIHEIGPIVADTICEYMADAENKAMIDRMIERGLRIIEEAIDNSKKPLDGMTFVFTGTLEAMDRKEAENRVEALGGRASSSVSKNTSIVVAGSSAGSKLDKAKTLGVRIMDEKEFSEYIEKVEQQ